jgi:hypothetical protein
LNSNLASNSTLFIFVLALPWTVALKHFPSGRRGAKNAGEALRLLQLPQLLRVKRKTPPRRRGMEQQPAAEVPLE